jgi:SAM-dependent methyltransferase
VHLPYNQSVTDNANYQRAAGVYLTCVDSSRGMLDVLSRKLRDHGLQAEVLCADICRLQLPASFELAIWPFQSFMEILGEARQRAALAAVFACLTPGGRFICTLHNLVVRRTQVDGVLRVVGRVAPVHKRQSLPEASGQASPATTSPATAPSDNLLWACL